MKTCGYCGCENDDGASACAGCGTGIEETPTPRPKSKARGRWPDFRLRYAGYALGVTLFYFMSFGPVMYFCTKVTTTTVAAGPTVAVDVTVEIPGWLGVIYYPALALYGSQRPDSAYSAYLQWWVERRQSSYRER